jgi:polygalacturonase
MVFSWTRCRCGCAALLFDVRTLGAKADGKTNDREATNRTVDAASAAGGGTVYFPAGTYVTGSIRLKSNITVQLDHGTSRSTVFQWLPGDAERFLGFLPGADLFA